MLASTRRHLRTGNYLLLSNDAAFQEIGTKPSLGQVSADELLRSIFGPERWATKAARHLGCTPRFVRMVAQGYRLMPRRWPYMLRNIVEFRGSDLARECRLRKAAIDRKYARQMKKLEQARRYLENATKLRRK